MAGLFGGARKLLDRVNTPGADGLSLADKIGLLGGSLNGQVTPMQIRQLRQQGLAARDQQFMEDRLRAQLSPADTEMGSGTGAAPTVEQQMAALNEARLLNPAVADKFAPFVAQRQLGELTQGRPVEERLAVMLNPERAGLSYATQFEDMPLAGGTVRTRGNQAVAGARRAERFDDRWGFYDPITNEAGFSDPRGPTRGENLDVSKLQQEDRQFYDNLGLEREKVEAQRGTAARETETGLRKEFAALPDVKAFNEVAASYGSMQSAARNPTAAGDLSLIFSYMKMLDPGSVVREQEFANAQNAAGVPDQIRNMYNRVLSGERLNPNQRNDFLSNAGNIYQSRRQRFEQIASEYDALAQNYGAEGSRVVGSRDRPVDQPRRVTSESEYRNLPSGTLFIAPDGTTRRKP